MVHAIAILLASQLAGETLSYGLNLPMPGPVIGLLLLFAGLCIWQFIVNGTPGTIGDTPLGTTSATLLQHLSILFVPAGVGAIDHLGLLRDYGIAIFAGLVHRSIEGIERDYLLLQFAEADELYVPIHQVDRINYYVGPDSRKPKLSKLGSETWKRSREKTARAVKAIAYDLLELYAKRQTVEGYGFGKDTEWQQALELRIILQELSSHLFKGIHGFGRQREIGGQIFEFVPRLGIGNKIECHLAQVNIHFV